MTFAKFLEWMKTKKWYLRTIWGFSDRVRSRNHNCPLQVWTGKKDYLAAAVSRGMSLHTADLIMSAADFSFTAAGRRMRKAVGL